MKKIFLIAITIPLLFSCNRNQTVPNDTSNSAKEFAEESFYESVFPSPKEDSAYSIPDCVYSADWMQQYILFIKKNFNCSEDLWTRGTGEESFDCRYWSLAYVDSDTIPEMLLYGGCWASGSIILTQYDGNVFESPKGGFMFIEGGKGLLNSQWAHGDEMWGEVYEMSDGRFEEKINYYCFTEYCDTSDIDKYGLVKENMTNWQRGDGTVGISGIKINGKVVDVNYGYCNWFADDLKPILDSLYYTKGSSIRFPKPKPTDLRPIGDLCDSLSR